MHVLSERRLDHGVTERAFVLGDVPGLLWTPRTASDAARPLLLLGHPGGLERMYPRLLARARRAAADGFVAVTVELPGSGVRPPIVEIDAARVDLRRALADGRPVDGIVDRLVVPLVEAAVPEWRQALDAVLALPGTGGRVGYSGGVIAIGVRLITDEPRIAAAGLFAGSLVPDRTFDEARRITIPLHVLLQWDDEGNDRDAALRLFDAFRSREKTLQANTGGHRGVPDYAGEDAARFFLRHLG